MARFVVGIDLGTTNSALAFAEFPADRAEAPAIRSFPIPQVVGIGETAERSTLPSFVYLSGEKEFPAGATNTPWGNADSKVVGWFAREQGTKVPGRLVGSAKSWLSHPGIDPRKPVLPAAANPDVAKISPVEASAAYLSHLRSAWNFEHPDDLLESQEIYLTVPASFDPGARESTIEAAALAGLSKVTLLEEPQAAFYAWLASSGDDWRKQVKVGDRILVCDVGGGTTDFTLIGVAEREGELALERLAVGEHILLGGDNMDLALAYAVGGALPGGMESLDPVRQAGLAHACRAAKEALFASPTKSEEPVVLLGRGSKVIGGSIKTTLKRETLDAVLLDGFLPRCAPTDEPTRGRRSGLAELGLPYASDPAITRHLARFLKRQADALDKIGGSAYPGTLLFNGGVFKAEALRLRVMDVLKGWSNGHLASLENVELDLAVSRGAVYYGLARSGRGVRIRGGVPRSYYVGIESSAPAIPGVPPPVKAICVVPFGIEEGEAFDVPGPETGLIVGEPAIFRFFGSTTRRDDVAGTALERWNAEELQELAPIETELETDAGSQDGELVPVRLHAHVTEVGALDLWCRSTRDDRRWKLQYHVRDPH